MEILKTRPLPNSTNGWMITEWMTLHFFLSLSLSLSLKNKTIPFLNGEGPIYIGSAFLSIKGEGGGGDCVVEIGRYLFHQESPQPFRGMSGLLGEEHYLGGHSIINASFGRWVHSIKVAVCEI